MNTEETILLNDKAVARLISMSPSWVRGQRMKRRRGQAHSFTVDAVLIGGSPRYQREAVSAWLAQLGTHQIA